MRIICCLVCCVHNCIPIAKRSIRICGCFFWQKIREAEDRSEYVFLTITDTGHTDKPFHTFAGRKSANDQMAVHEKRVQQEAVVTQMPVRRRQQAQVFQFCADALDLFICKRLMSLMGGEVYAEIHGDCFSVTLVVKLA